MRTDDGPDLSDRIPEARAPGAHVVLVGVGNIGSHLVSHLGRMTEVGRVTIIDRDRYERANLVGQEILPGDIGRAKSRAQAARLRRLRRDLAVEPVVADVERIPLGMLHGDVLLAGVDNRRARQHLNDAAWLLGVPWIDAAVDGAGLLVRVAVYVPGEDAGCLERGWNEADYAALEQTYPCLAAAGAPAVAVASGKSVGASAGHAAASRSDGAFAGRATASRSDGASAGHTTGTGPHEALRPTGAPSSLGALAAALSALECRRLLGSAGAAASAGRQIFFDAEHHQYYCTHLRRNPDCRREDHVPGRPRELRLDLRTVHAGDLLDGRAAGLDEAHAGAGPFELRVGARRWVREVVCGSCGAAGATLRLADGDLTRPQGACPRCGGRRYARGVEAAAYLVRESLSRKQRRTSLYRLGLRRHDVLTLRRTDGTIFQGRVIDDSR